MAEKSEDLLTQTIFKYNQMCRRRDGWRNIFSLLCKYIRMRPVWFGDTNVNWRTPVMSVANVSDDTVLDSARTAAASLGGALWPNNDESFEIVPREDYSNLSDTDFMFKTEEVKNYLREVTKRLRSAIGSFEGRFLLAQAEHLDEQVVMGTSGVFGEEDETNDQQPFHFRSCSVETCVIDENSKGHIDTVYFEYNYTARQVVEKYGYKNCSARTQGLYDGDRLDDFIKVIQAVEPRPDGKVGADILHKPYRSIHFEWSSKHLLKESGMDECPVFITRFRKLPTELYGRSLAMDALPSVKELNVLRAAFSKAMLLILNPPYGYYHDQIAGGGNFDMSPGARVALYATGRIPQGQLPIMPLLQIQLPPVAEQRIQNLTEIIDGKFLNDVLTDFNNKTRMTLGETNERVQLRHQALSGIFTRQIVELYHPMIKWAFNVMMRRGLLGLNPLIDATKIQMMQALGMSPLVIPQEFAKAMASGRTPYTIRFISPAARAMKADTLNGLEKLTNYVLAITNAGGVGAADNIDADDAIRQYQDLVGAPVSVIVGMDKLKKIRDQRAQAQQMAQQIQMAQAKAEIAKNQGKATLDNSKAGMPPQLQATQGGQAA
jgi:hypothetical protein